MIVKGLRAVIPQKAIDAGVASLGVAVSTGIHFKLIDIKSALELLLLGASLGLVLLRIFYLVRNKGKGESE